MDDSLFSLSNLLKRIERFYRGEQEFLSNYRDTFSITGGEPTLSAHLFPVIKRINELFPGTRIICLSNGRRFAYAHYAKEFLKLSDNLELKIAVHGHNSKLHDRITQVSGSFKQTIKGLENILRFKKPRQQIGIRIVIHRLNYKFLENIVKFVKDSFSEVGQLVFIFCEIEGQACKNFKRVKLTYSELLPYISRIYKLLGYFSEVRFYHFPLCALPVQFYPYIWRTLPDFEVSFPRKCKDCYLKELCLGVHKGYLEYIGDEEFKPVKRKLSIKKSTNWHHPIIKINM